MSNGSTTKPLRFAHLDPRPVFIYNNVNQDYMKIGGFTPSKTGVKSESDYWGPVLQTLLRPNSLTPVVLFLSSALCMAGFAVSVSSWLTLQYFVLAVYLQFNIYALVKFQVMYATRWRARELMEKDGVKWTLWGVKSLEYWSYNQVLCALHSLLGPF